MKKYLAFAAIALAAAVSCQKEAAPAEEMPVAPVREGYVEVTLSATSDVQTKAVLDGNTVVWAVGEEVAVYPGDATTPEKFTVKAVDFDQVTITGSVPAGTTSFIAVYPFKQARSRSGETLHMILPESQTVPSGGNIDPKAMSSVAYFADATAKPQFKNVFSLIEFKVSKPDGIRDAGFYADCSEASYYLGEIEVKVSTTGDAPVVTNLLGGFNTTVLPASGTQFEADKSYYAVMPPCENPVNFGFYVNTESKVASKKAAAGKTLARNKGLSVGNLTTDDLVWKWQWIHNAQELNAFLAEAPAYTADDEVLLANDIDMTGESITTCGNWAGIFNGNGYKIKNWTSDGDPMFGTVTGEVCNLTIDSSCKFSNPGTGNFSFLVCELKGRMTDCVNEADVQFDMVGNAMTQYVFGMLVGRSNAVDAKISNCINRGKLEVSFTTGTEQMKAQYVGGIVGIVGQPSTDNNLRVENCSNEADHMTLTGTCGSAKTLNTIYFGGIVGGTGINKGSSNSDSGYTKHYGILKGNVNKADVSATWTGGTGGYFNIGGILGAGECTILECTNDGDISFTSNRSSSNAGPNVGGIAASLSGQSPDGINIKDCVNNGNITMDGHFTNAGNAYANSTYGNMWAACGGVVGNLGVDTVLADNCDNYGKVTVDSYMGATSGSTHSLGGVFGRSFAELRGCDNYGETDLTSYAKTAHLGGIVGYGSKKISNCTLGAKVHFSHNAAPLTTNQADAIGNMGGIVGYHATGAELIDNCSTTSSASITVDQTGSETRLGGISGMGYTEFKNCTNNAAIEYSRDESAEHVVFIGGVFGTQNIETLPTSYCENNGNINVTAGTLTGDVYVGGIGGRFSLGTDANNCTNNGHVTVVGGGMTNQFLVGGIFGKTNTAAVVLDRCINSGNLIVSGCEINSNDEFSYLGGIVGSYKASADNMIKNSSNTGTLTSTSAVKTRAGGLAGAWYGQIENSVAQCSINVSGATAGSRIGGYAGYGSAPVTGGSIDCSINVSGNAAVGNAGLLYGDCARAYTLAGLSVGGSITTDDNTKAGILFGGYYDNDADADAANRADYTLGTESSPLTISASANVNGTAVKAAPSEAADLVGDLSHLGTLNFVKVEVK